MRCPLQSEFEAALTAFLLGAVHRYFPLSKNFSDEQLRAIEVQRENLQLINCPQL
ncbi:hypothetical protein T03_10013 [Trichinella britovi]|uniref:Uncharacterized protein n=1 Tax=Trichinella britovi TaxID=45882 RepID=A0A0V1BYU4_TRIBR|nr:hypothetical protein T03_10013 [Trichinella britovi]